VYLTPLVTAWRRSGDYFTFWVSSAPRRQTNKQITNG